MPWILYQHLPVSLPSPPSSLFPPHRTCTPAGKSFVRHPMKSSLPPVVQPVTTSTAHAGMPTSWAYRIDTRTPLLSQNHSQPREGDMYSAVTHIIKISTSNADYHIWQVEQYQLTAKKARSIWS